MTRFPFRRVRAAATVLAVAGLTGGALTACGSDDDPSTTTAGTAAAAAAATSYPVTLENCGREVVVEAAPQRAVSLDQGSTEILLSLGLEDRMVGTATWTDPVRENLAQANEQVPRLADNAPSFERVLKEEPDFASASFGYAFDHGAKNGRERYLKLGVPTYLSTSDCDGYAKTDGTGRSTPLELDDVYQEVRELARIFDVAPRGEELVGELQERVEQATAGLPKDGEPPTVAYWFADTKTPYVAGCCGSSGMISRAVGAKNVFEDSKQEWPQVSWETMLERDPDYLVLGDLSRRQNTGDALDAKIEFLESDAVAKRLTAVREKRYVVMNGADMNPSIRTVDGIEKLAAGLKKQDAQD